MDHKTENHTYSALLHLNDYRMKLFLESIIIGGCVGLIIIAYRLIIEKVEIITEHIYTLQAKNSALIPVWFLILILVGYIIGIIVKKEPMVTGSGIPQVKGVLLRYLDIRWWKIVAGKFFGGILSIFAGLSLGREGPSVQIGSAVGQGFSETFDRKDLEEKMLITSGASAGLCAAFGAPLAGVIFALEEIHKNFSPLVLISAMSASLTAEFALGEILGVSPLFNFKGLAVLPLDHYFYLIVLGIILGFFGVLFNKFLLKTKELYGRQKWLPSQMKPIFPILLAGVLGFVLPDVIGGGYNLINSVVEENFALKILVLLLIAKFIFTILSYASGAPGGIFLPMLAIGALTGDLYGNVLVQFFNLSNEYINSFIILAMAGYFTAIVRAPITASILLLEMTGSFEHLLALAVVSIFAYIVADFIGSKPIYESLLEMILNNKEDENHSFAHSETNIILEIPVCLGSVVDNKMIKNIKWPEECLLVGIRRGESEIIPKGNTIVYPGDYLIVLVNEDNVVSVEERLSNLAEKSIWEMTGKE